MLLTVPFYRWGKLRTSDQSKVTQMWNGGASILNIQSDLSIPDACAVVRRLPTDTACLPYALSRAYAAHNTVYLRCQEIRHTSALRAPSPGEERMQLQKKALQMRGSETRKRGTPNPSRGGGQLSALTEGVEEMERESGTPGTASAKAHRQEKTRQKQSPGCKTGKDYGERSLQRLARAWSCKTLTIRLWLSTWAVLWAQGAEKGGGQGMWGPKTFSTISWVDTPHPYWPLAHSGWGPCLQLDVINTRWQVDLRSRNSRTMQSTQH